MVMLRVVMVQKHSRYLQNLVVFARQTIKKSSSRSGQKTGVLLQLLCIILSLGPFSLTAAEPTAKSKLYDTAADGKQQISDALKTAQAENKRLLLKFGANW